MMMMMMMMMMIVVMAVIECDRDRQSTNMSWRKSKTVFGLRKILSKKTADAEARQQSQFDESRTCHIWIPHFIRF